MPSERRRLRGGLIAVALGVVLALAAAPAILCEKALYMPEWARYQAAPAVAEAVARDTSASWQPAEIRAADNAVLHAWCFTPPHPSGAAVILLHGVVDTRQGVLGQARFLLRHGYTVLAPDARGHGESGGEPISYGVREADDVHRWADWLCQRQRVDRLYGLGVSMGAAILLQSLRVEPRFRAVVSECPFVTFEEISYDRMRQWGGLNRTAAWPLVRPAFFYARLRHGIDLDQASPAAVVRSTTVPILLIHGTADTNIPPRHSRELHALNPRATELWEVPGATHVTALAAEPQVYEEKVVAWFSR
jgi:dipeptidyl aminopeptidase/acylaminoacyl peptidase